jgi:hypothetical protein
VQIFRFALTLHYMLAYFSYTNATVSVAGPPLAGGKKMFVLTDNTFDSW